MELRLQRKKSTFACTITNRAKLAVPPNSQVESDFEKKANSDGGFSSNIRLQTLIDNGETYGFTNWKLSSMTGKRWVILGKDTEIVDVFGTYH